MYDETEYTSSNVTRPSLLFPQRHNMTDTTAHYDSTDMEVQLHDFFTSVLDVDERIVISHGRFNPRKRNPVAH
jgi:hypothetical protein